MIKRNLKPYLDELLAKHPAVALLGPRQVGKTTLAHELVTDRAAVYLDLESPRSLAKISDIEQYCELNADKLLVFDEIQRMPELFAPLRSIIDQRRRQGQKYGQFLLLGSASIELLRQTSETLAGRIAFCELFPLTATEMASGDINTLWQRGGFPESFLAGTDAESLNWRLHFIRTYLERDIPQFGPRIPAETLRRFWTMLAHNQGATLNASALARGLDVTGVTISRYLDLLVDLLLVRRLQPWTSHQGKRLVKSPKIYVRDSGITHALLNIETLDDLLGHPVTGGSWEGFVIENIASVLPERAAIGFYRTKGGAEIDLIIDFGTGELWAVEIKRSSAPTIAKGFHIACEDLKPTQKYAVYGGNERFPMSGGIQIISLTEIMHEIAKR
ncbi:MAG: ATP-binding protein [Candidatus Competibacteraceae bacterium]|nr:ATP-binding protein [Candidatus Competibacteraceae bacterium]